MTSTTSRGRTPHCTVIAKVVTNLASEPRAIPAALVDGVDQEPVEHGQHEQRHANERDDAKPVVRFFVDVVAAQRGAALLKLVGDRVERDVPLVRRGGRARDTEHRDHQDDAFGARLGAQHAAPERVAHGYVPFDGERNGQQNRSVTCRQNAKINSCDGGGSGLALFWR